MKPIGVFGGTFDPIHYGHLRTAYELLRHLRLPEVRFLPCGLPPHRVTPVAGAHQRLSMVQMAIAGQPGFVVDDRELHRDGPSYSVDTLVDLRAEFPDRGLCLFVGMDAFLGLPRWHRWEQVFELAHVVVAHRPGWQAPDTGTLGQLVRERATARVDDLHSEAAGRIYIHAVTQLEISSTAVRTMIAEGGDPRFLMPDGVRDVIDKSGCYRRPKETDCTT